MHPRCRRHTWYSQSAWCELAHRFTALRTRCSETHDAERALMNEALVKVFGVTRRLLEAVADIGPHRGKQERTHPDDVHEYHRSYIEAVKVRCAHAPMSLRHGLTRTRRPGTGSFLHYRAASIPPGVQRPRPPRWDEAQGVHRA